MKKVFAAIPFRYNMTEDEVREYRRKQEEMAHKAEIQLAAYCQLPDLQLFYLVSKDYVPIPNDGDLLVNGRQRAIRIFYSECIMELCSSNYVIFSEDWQSSKEIRGLHRIAEELDIPILEL